MSTAQDSVRAQITAMAKEATERQTALEEANRALVAAGRAPAKTLEDAMKAIDEIKVQNESLVGKGMQPATQGDIIKAIQAGEQVVLQLPPGMTSVSMHGVEYKAKEGYISLHVQHALHVVEAFGARIVSEVKADVAKLFGGGKPGEKSK